MIYKYVSLVLYVLAAGFCIALFLVMIDTDKVLIIPFWPFNDITNIQGRWSLYSMDRWQLLKILFILEVKGRPGIGSITQKFIIPDNIGQCPLQADPSMEGWLRPGISELFPAEEQVHLDAGYRVAFFFCHNSLLLLNHKNSQKITRIQQKR